MSPSRPLVSVVVPVRDGAGTIRACVRSILAADWPVDRREVIVVDNASRDGSPEALEGLPVRLVTEERVGRSHARNRGVLEARGGIVAFTDADCLVDSGWIAGLVRGFDGSDVWGVGGEIQPLEGHGVAACYARAHEGAHQRFVLGLDPPFAITSNVAYDRRTFDVVGLFDPAYATAEDVDFGWRFHRAGYRYAYRPDALVYHLPRDSLGALLRQQEGYGHGRALLRSRYGRERGFALGTLRELGVAARRYGGAVARREPGRDLLGAEVAVRVALRAGAARHDLESLARRGGPMLATLGDIAFAASRGARRLVLRTSRTPLAVAWRAGYEATARCVAAAVCAGLPDASAYVAGSHAHGDAVYGLSDLDLVVLAGPAERGLIEARAHRLRASVPPLRGLVPHLWVYDRAELRAASQPYPTAGRAVYLGAEPARDPMGLVERPGLHGSADGWRLLRGPSMALPGTPGDEQARRLAAWLELQYRLKYLFTACLEPTAPYASAHAVALLAEPLRVWLWLARGERAAGRRAVLLRALHVYPGDGRAIDAALSLHDRLHREPRAPLAELVPACMRVTADVGRLVDGAAERAGSTGVLLVGADAEVAGVPLADWRALAVPPVDGEGAPLSERLAVLEGAPGDPAAIADAARRAAPGIVPALRERDLLLEPTADIWGAARLRTVQCRATDPVSFALLDGVPTASFPELRGWRIRDVAGRAVQEHGAWLVAQDGRLGEPPGWVGRRPGVRYVSRATALMLVSAARAALLHESVVAGAPVLPATLAAAADLLAERDAAAGGVARAASAGAAGDLTPRALTALRRAVEALPAYAGPQA